MFQISLFPTASRMVSPKILVLTRPYGGGGDEQRLELEAGLMLEFMPSPVAGLDNLKPHFSWTAPSMQAAFRVNVGTWAPECGGRNGFRARKRMSSFFSKTGCADTVPF